MTVEIPIAAGKRIADEYGYDQVVIVARKVGGPEHVTTYGVDKAHCGVAARMGDFFKHKLMGWPEPAKVLQLPPLTDVMYHAFRGYELEVTTGGDESTTVYLDDSVLDEMWDNINTALRAAGVAA